MADDKDRLFPGGDLLARAEEGKKWLAEILPRLEAQLSSREVGAIQTLTPYLYMEEPGEIHEIVKRLLIGEKSLNQDVLRQLKRKSEWACDSSVVSGEVVEARVWLHSFFWQKKSWLESQGLYPLVYGSLQYGDPVNLDADIVLVSFSDAAELPPESAGVISRMTERIINLWRKKKLGRRETDEPHLDAFTLGVVESFLTCPDSYSYGDVSNAPEALTGRAIFSEDAARVTEFQKELKELIEASPLLCVMANIALEKCLETRKLREV